MIKIETFYLIDYENVRGEGLSGCQDLTKTDHIVIFFTQNAKNIDMRDISNHGFAQLEMIEVPAGKQSADMHISSYLGYLSGENGKNCKVVIISKDTDFDNVIKFWKKKTGIAVSRTEQIKKKATTKTASEKSATATKKSTAKDVETIKEELKKKVMQAVRQAKNSASVSNTVAQVVCNLYGEKDLLVKVHNALKGRYTNYLDIYDAIKPIVVKYDKEASSEETKSSVSSKKNTEINTEIQKALGKGGFSNDITNYVASTVVKNIGAKNYKQQIYRTIISKYGQGNGLNIYNHIKKLL